MAPPRAKTRVLIVDDSLVAREMLSQILCSDPDIEVIGQAKDGLEAVDMVTRLRPDLVTMDIHMPKMDGLQATERIMAYTPTPILVVSTSVYGEGMGAAFDALTFGALDVIKKPEPRDWAELEGIGREVIRKVKMLSRVRVITHIGGRRGHPRTPVGQPASSASRVGRTLVAIGSSTGGPSALLAVLCQLPVGFPVPVVIAQHIADGFVPGLVAWLDAACKIKVKAAVDGGTIEPGCAYFAPTGENLEVSGDVTRFSPRRPGQLYIPSADTLFESVVATHGSRAVGVLLTGMGADGAAGLRKMHERGAATIAQDEATSTVFGMPKAAIDLGAVDQVLAIEDIGGAVAELIGV